MCLQTLRYLQANMTEQDITKAAAVVAKRLADHLDDQLIQRLLDEEALKVKQLAQTKYGIFAYYD